VTAAAAAAWEPGTLLAVPGIPPGKVPPASSSDLVEVKVAVAFGS
jgi:hypothetical protein